MKPILEIQDLSKKYQINKNKQPYLSLRDSLFSFLKPSIKMEEFWALRNISFDVMPGETIGIIGKNGAGKSTLLKVLSKITPPTSGKIIGRGRIASLLEVGTGFHPELSGRENVFMNGSILGMRRSEIEKNFDAIIDFSGIEKFIDTPLKHYSSGMQLRLAFAVAAFLQNEILIIDEVLAVGDAEFQKKCLGKMEDVSKDGRTVLFVSHDSNAISKLTKRSILLDEGKLVYDADSELVLKRYADTNNIIKQVSIHSDKDIYIHDFYVNSKENNYANCNEKVSFHIHIESKVNKKGIFVGFGINELLGRRLFTPFSKHFDKEYELKVGENIITCEIDRLPLKPDIYNVEIYVGDSYNAFEYYKERLEFEVLATQSIPIQRIPVESQGYFIVDQKWK